MSFQSQPKVFRCALLSSKSRGHHSLTPCCSTGSFGWGHNGRLDGPGLALNDKDIEFGSLGLMSSISLTVSYMRLRGQSEFHSSSTPTFHNCRL